MGYVVRTSVGLLTITDVPSMLSGKGAADSFASMNGPEDLSDLSGYGGGT